MENIIFSLEKTGSVLDASFNLQFKGDPKLIITMLCTAMQQNQDVKATVFTAVMFFVKDNPGARPYFIKALDL